MNTNLQRNRLREAGNDADKIKVEETKVSIMDTKGNKVKFGGEA
jgi:hypothetical protein